MIFYEKATGMIQIFCLFKVKYVERQDKDMKELTEGAKQIFDGDKSEGNYKKKVKCKYRREWQYQLVETHCKKYLHYQSELLKEDKW